MPDWKSRGRAIYGQAGAAPLAVPASWLRLGVRRYPSGPAGASSQLSASSVSA